MSAIRAGAQGSGNVRTLDELFLAFIRECFQRLLGGLGDEERRENAREHEEREDLKAAKPKATRRQLLAANNHTRIYAHVVEELSRAPDILEPLESELRDDRPELPAGCGNAVRRRAIARGEHLPRYDERGRVRAAVLEEVRQAVEHDERDLPA